MISLPLFLSDVAGSEILLIMVFVLMFFGSKSIPGIARTMGRTIRQIKDASQEVQDEIRKSTGDIKGDFNLQRMVDETKEDIERPFREHARTLDQAINFEPPQSFVKPVPQITSEDLSTEQVEPAAENPETTDSQPEGPKPEPTNTAEVAKESQSTQS